MNCFAIDSWAKIRLKYDCGSLPKNQKKCFSCGGKLSGKRKEDARMPCGIVNGKQLMDKENEEYQQQELDEHQRQELDEHEHAKQRADALALKLAHTYEELTRLLERNPGMKRRSRRARPRKTRFTRS
jgi:hypothetical protein